MSTTGVSTNFGSVPKNGDVVLYVNGKPSDTSAKPQNALVYIVFHDLGSRPALTLVTVLSGERGVCYRSQVPHRSRWVDEKGFYLLTSEVWP
jgi:hypothetical protein